MARTDIQSFRRKVWEYYKKNGRNNLPWRKTTDPYKILVSEIMLQQTQVSRVIEKYKSFIKKFPTVRKLADAKLSEVLKEWNGLGYNRRAKHLHNAAKIVSNEFGGDIKKALSHPLPGVGAYTRAAVRTFAFNEPHAFIETNIRTVFVYVFLNERPTRSLIADAELLPLIEKAAQRQDPRTWHWALMDYGAYLKRSGVRNNNQSKHYTKQSKFEGSLRQVRGAILRSLSQDKNMSDLVGRSSAKFAEALKGLERDGLIKREKGKWRIA